MKAKIVETQHQWVRTPYLKLTKRKAAWKISVSELIFQGEDTLGFHLGCFLLKYNFEMQPQLEDHDVFHVLTDTGIAVTDEIGMQYFLLGNGKKSIYMFVAIAAGTLFYPFRFRTFLSFYKRGKDSHRLYDLDFLKMLDQPIETLKYSLNIR